MGDIPPKRNRKEPMCFSFLSLSGSEIVERLFNKITQMSVPRNPLPKYVAKNSVKADFHRSWLAAFGAVAPHTAFLRQEGPARAGPRGTRASTARTGQRCRSPKLRTIIRRLARTSAE